MGQGIALALVAGGWEVTLLARSARPVASPLALRTGDWGPAVGAAELVLVATPDDAIPDAAAALVACGAVGPAHVVLHLAGPLDRSALSALAPTGAALGSFHPLQTVADSARAPARLRGAFAGIEGDARALAAAERLAEALGMTPVRLRAEAKPLYHAAAVITANYTVALAAMAERIAQSAGVPEEVVGRMYQPLLAGAVGNVAALGARRALTGPIRRGDVATVRAHLTALAPGDAAIYRAVGRAALALAREAGLGEQAAAELARLLAD
ncbi:MAG TPA: DUF2520 domain-containing protein [Gemmatimonadales bacterium]|nr:DUF2520 domain-containing protein [Gemmatimonadales bacterium]